ncbi:leucine-rich repeat-containing protein 56 isoform X2 [Scyliorhinus canicula]|uniref:leucine-rich repeat-containing protein 56 isoform X2 n=1 Tax=Scyliorhinus canicula TaxID=7830 RepID=UPI0018F63567|nr:leucine-rich repeat-containing protein 56 isoform X2 [Scyliorhinus canicula]
MELHQHPAFVTRAGTATVRVLDFGQPGLQNPNPVIKDETEFLIEEYLSPSKLRALTETEDLRKVKVLEMCVDTQDNSLGNFGAHLPSLVQLKLNSSFIASVRDLGTSLTKLQVLWMARCSLTDLDGIPSFCSLKDSNCNYREMVKKLIPHLKYLDDIPVSETCIQSNCTVKKDWLIVKEAIKDGISAEDLENLDDSSATGRPASRKHKNCASRKASTSQRPHSAGRLSMGSTVGALRKGIPDARLHDGASDLTHGAGSIFCGNPVTALRARRKKQGASSDEAGNWFSQYTHLPEHTYDSLEIDSRTRDDIFSELRAWRDEHNRRLEAILKEQEAQVLKIDHNDNDALSNSSTDEEKKDDYSDEWNGPESPCPSSLVPSSLNFPSNMESLLVADFNRMLPPVPPSLQEAPARSHKVLDFRVRCLRRSVQMEKEPLQKDDEDCGVHDENREAACSHGVKPKNRLDDRLTVYAAMKNLRPVSGPATVGLRSVKSKVDRRPQKVIDSHQPIIRSSTKTPERPLSLNPVRPLTAKAALQRLPNRPLLLPSRGNKTTS